MLRAASILLILSALTAPSVVLIPSQATQDATNNWNALANFLNANGTATNQPGFRFIMSTYPGASRGIVTAVGSNKIWWANHIGISVGQTVCYESARAAASPTLYTITATSTSGDNSISTVTPNLPLWAPVETNDLTGQTVVAWGTGRSFDPSGTITTNGGSYRVFPLRDDPGTIRSAPFYLYGATLEVYYRIYSHIGSTAGVTYGDSSGPAFSTNSGSVKFVGCWNGSDSNGTTLDENNYQTLNGTFGSVSLINSVLGGDLNGGTNLIAQSLPTLNVSILRVGR